MLRPRPLALPSAFHAEGASKKGRGWGRFVFGKPAQGSGGLEGRALASFGSVKQKEADHVVSNYRIIA